ncbi:efflux RND transporter periplasmic adaptor subunit [Brevibacillus sp. SYSU BS000544]|uniref:efflux RND transporter periplasmic adaptor subunit n=1 Tax=Brevibacillus sp. SYSU BS000544 TaxID=3416443 RepID=UPI003CE4F64F
MKKQWKWLIWSCIFVLIAAYFVWMKQKPIQVEVLEIQPQTLADVVTEDGTVVSKRESRVSGEIGGKINRIHVTEGQFVKKGTLLYEIDTEDTKYQLARLQGELTSVEGQEKQTSKSPYSSEIARQQAVIEEANLQLDVANEEWERMKSMYEANAVSKQQLDQADRAVKQAQNALSREQQGLQLILDQHKPVQGTRQQFTGTKDSLTAQIEQLKFSQAKGLVSAPMDGVIKEILFHEGEMIGPATPVVTLFQSAPFEVETFVLSEDVPDIQPGMEVTLVQERKGKAEHWSGKVSKIASVAVSRTSPLGLSEQRVKITIQPAKDHVALRLGDQIDVQFVTHEEQNRLILPKTVLFPMEDEDAVWVVREGKAYVQKVLKGYETADEVAVDGGLVPGELVINDPQVKGLADGKAVEAKAVQR